METIDTHCARCLRPAPATGSRDYAYWEVLARDGADDLLVLCPNCITPEEQAQMDEQGFPSD